MSSYSRVVLANLAHGALDQHFQVELDKVVRNIGDLNTDAKTKRSITMVVEFRPSVDRDSVQTFVRCKSTLAAPSVQETVIHLATDPATGKIAAFASDFKQAGLFEPATALAETVVPE